VPNDLSIGVAVTGHTGIAHQVLCIDVCAWAFGEANGSDVKQRGAVAARMTTGNKKARANRAGFMY
jgi:hypothetical protein